MIKRENATTVRLCCGKKGCPTVIDLGNGMVKITDDFGKEVEMTKEEAKLVSDGVRTLDGEKLILG
ncbi:MAG: hypothetical protein HQK53_13520 [Oligoflexia bacterium]|nr:hypothetical protein [Oligoflexia bacterium]